MKTKRILTMNNNDNSRIQNKIENRYVIALLQHLLKEAKDSIQAIDNYRQQNKLDKDEEYIYQDYLYRKRKLAVEINNRMLG